MKKLINIPINAFTDFSKFTAIDLINILNKIPELELYDISLEESSDGTLLLAVGDIVYEIDESTMD